MPTPPFITLASPLARTANGNTEALDLSKLNRGQLPDKPMLRVQSNVTAASGTTPSLTVVIEDSVDGVNWNIVGTFAAQTGVNRAVINIAISGVAQAAGFAWPFNPRKIRARWTITGTTPSLTFSVLASII